MSTPARSVQRGRAGEPYDLQDFTSQVHPKRPQVEPVPGGSIIYDEDEWGRPVTRYVSVEEDMSTAELEAAQGDDQAPTDAVELDRWVDWKLRRIQQVKAQQDRNTALVRAEMERLTTWVDSENQTLQNSIDWFESQIEQATRGYDFGNKKSRNLPHGTFGKRITPGGVKIVDKALALEFAKAKGIPTKVTEEVQVKPLKEYVESTGMTPDGCIVVPEAEHFYVKVADHVA